MELLEHLRRQFVYDEWANREVIAALRANSEAMARPGHLMAHIVAAERLWLERIKKQPQSLPVWPEFSIKQCEKQIAELSTLWKEYLTQISSDSLKERINYTNSKGEPWNSTVEEILTHVILHSAYHRGQIASEVRASGHHPALTDFILAARQGLIK